MDRDQVGHSPEGHPDIRARVKWAKDDHPVHEEKLSALHHHLQEKNPRANVPPQGILRERQAPLEWPQFREHPVREADHYQVIGPKMVPSNYVDNG